MNLAALALVCVNALAFTLPARPEKGRVYDLAGVLSPQGAARLQAITDDLARRDQGRIFIVTAPGLQGLGGGGSSGDSGGDSGGGGASDSF